MRATNQAALYGFAVLLALGGCGSSSKSGQLTLSTKTSADTATTTTPTSTGLPVGADVVLERVRIVIRDVKLESHAEGATTATTTTTKPDDSGTETETETEHAGEVEVKAGPVLLDLKADALTGAKLQEAISAQIPDGTYDELKLKIHPLADGEQTGDADVDAARASIILDGTFDGKTFRFVSHLSVQQKLEGTFTVSSGSAANITLSLDLTSWFTGPGGEALDPSSAAAQGLIEANIAASLHAFEDDDHDGKDDHGEHAGPGGGGGDDGAGHG
jgi:hypothetical protein